MKLSDYAVSFFFPNRCCGCGKVIAPDEELCPDCRALRVHFCYDRGFCKVCGQPKEHCICSGRHFFEKAVFAFIYADSVKRSIESFKFDGRLFYGKLFARQMLNAAEESGILKDTSFIVPIPTDLKRKLRRGYNQTEILASRLSKLSGIPCINALEKIIPSGTQHDLGGLERAGNVAATFEVARKYAAVTENAKILLVDDIMTTHATLNEAARTLLIFGADKVNAIAIAAAPKKRTPEP